MQIKNFLERVNNEITSEELAEIIKDTFIIHKKRSLCPSIPVLDSSLTKESPLQDLLKTPASKHLKLQEKDREIDKLRRELTNEKYERVDFETEMKEQHLKISKYFLLFFN